MEHIKKQFLADLTASNGRLFTKIMEFYNPEQAEKHPFELRDTSIHCLVICPIYWSSLSNICNPSRCFVFTILWIHRRQRRWTSINWCHHICFPFLKRESKRCMRIENGGTKQVMLQHTISLCNAAFSLSLFDRKKWRESGFLQFASRETVVCQSAEQFYLPAHIYSSFRNPQPAQWLDCPFYRAWSSSIQGLFF